ncbi:hypothetical protein QJS66_11520 [Kocuria rhizophila]|nr:hypothetical protein QJS66_11520 [Kocuria rhizophila]
MTLRDYVDVLRNWWKAIALTLVGGARGGSSRNWTATRKVRGHVGAHASIPTSDSATEPTRRPRTCPGELKSTPRWPRRPTSWNRAQGHRRGQDRGRARGDARRHQSDRHLDHPISTPRPTPRRRPRSWPTGSPTS